MQQLDVEGGQRRIQAFNFGQFRVDPIGEVIGNVNVTASEVYLGLRCDSLIFLNRCGHELYLQH